MIMGVRSGWWSLNIITATRLSQEATRDSGRAALLRCRAARREETGEPDRCVHSGRWRGLLGKILASSAEVVELNSLKTALRLVLIRFLLFQSVFDGY